MTLTSVESEGYPSWLPKRPPPPAPQSTVQSCHSPPTSPTEPQFGRKPTPRSVRIVSLQDDVVNAPPKVWTRASGVPPTAFTPSEHDDFLPLPQPRFNAKNLHLQILRNPSRAMKLYFYIWPLLVFYHLPLQSFFDFNAVYMLLQVAKYPDPASSGKNWALGATAYIACWLTWIFVVCVTYEIIYSFARRWRLRRPLMLPIYLSSPAFNMAAMTSYTNFSFLQHLRFSALFQEHANAIAPPDLPDDPDDSSPPSSWKQFLAETSLFYSQNLPTVALLLPRAALSLALLLQFSSPSPLPTMRDTTFFSPEVGTLTSYAKGVLIANAAWTAWRAVVLLFSWLGLWVSSNQRLAGLCGPRHIWDEYEQEKTRSVYSEAASEYGAYRASHNLSAGDNVEYGGDELPWQWRENTRMRVQDAFEFCLNTRSDSSAAPLRWSSTSQGYGRRYRRHHRRRSAKGKEPSNEKSPDDGEDEGIEKVLAAVGFPSSAPSPTRRGVLSRDFFSTPVDTPTTQGFPVVTIAGPSTSTGGENMPLETPKMAKRNSKDKIPSLSTTAVASSSGVPPGAPLMSLPYPFSKHGAGQVSSKDLVPFPAGMSSSGGQVGKGGDKMGSKRSKSSRTSKSTKSATTATTETSERGSEEEEGEEEEEEDDEDDDEDSEESTDPSSRRGSESMSSLGQPISPSRHPLHHTTTTTRYGHSRNISGISAPTTSSGSHAHSHSIGSSSFGMSIGAGGMSILTQSTGNRESVDSGNPDSPVSPVHNNNNRQRASQSQGSNSRVGEPILLRGGGGGGGGMIPMPPRHPHAQGRTGSRVVATSSASASSAASSAASSNVAAAAALASLNVYPGAANQRAVAFPSVVHQQQQGERRRRRVDSGPSGTRQMEPELYIEGEGEQDDDEDDDDEEEEEEEDETGEREDRVGLLASTSHPSFLGSSTSIDQVRSRTHSYSSSSRSHSRSRHSSFTRARTHSYHHQQQPSVGVGGGGGVGVGISARERASSVGTSVRSLVLGARASLTQLDAIMRGAVGPAAGLGGFGGNNGNGSRPRSRVNSSMARLEEDVASEEVTTTVTELGERVGGRLGSGAAAANPATTTTAVDDDVVEGCSGYASTTTGSHSRSGSENLSSTENHTFGRPVLFMRPSSNPEQQQETVEEEEDGSDEIVLVERSARNSARNSAHNSGRASPAAAVVVHQNVPTVMRLEEEDDDERHWRGGRPGPAVVIGSSGEPQSLSSASFYSAQPSSTRRTSASPARSFVPASNSGSGSTPARSPERRQGIDIPGRQRHQQQQHLVPPSTSSSWSAVNPSSSNLSRQQPQQQPSSTSESQYDISTAAGSFITAPASIIDGGGGGGGSGSGDLQTLSSSSIWDETGGLIGMRLRGSGMGGMVERPGEDMGAGAGSWRVK